MTNKHLAYLLATTLLAAPAFAQTSSSPSSPGSSGATGAQSRPGAPAAPGAAQDRSTTTAPGSSTTGQSTTGQSTTREPSSPSLSGQSTTTTQSSSPSATSRSTMSSTDVNKPLAAPGANQMMASDIRGMRVYGANNENVGDINDLLLDQEGEVVALVVGVGGFLGIGQKDVAIPFKAFDFVTEGQAGASRTTTTTTGAPGSRTSDTTARGPATTGSTPGATTSTTSASQSAGVLKPERIVLRGMTKADLEAAPEFRKTGAASSPRSGSGDSRSAPATSGGGSNR